MLNITKEQQGKKTVIALEGRLDTNTASQLEGEIEGIGSDVAELEIDMTALEYISSAGLRVLLLAHKKMSKQGEMTVSHASEAVMEILDVTGFADILEVK